MNKQEKRRGVLTLSVILAALTLAACQHPQISSLSSNVSSSAGTSSEAENSSSLPQTESSSSLPQAESSSSLPQIERTLTKEDYLDKTHGGLLAEVWGNFTGLPTEFHFTTTANPADSVEWKVGSSYGTDDDTSMEYVWTDAMEVYGPDAITYRDLRDVWMSHIRDYIWCGNASARQLMSQGMLPPETGSKENNPNYRAIDAQIESEIFGMVDPGNIQNAKGRSIAWMRCVADGPALDTASFYSALASELYVNSDMAGALANVAALYSETSSAYKIYKNVEELKESGLNWRDARKSLYQDYFINNEVKKRDTLDCEINFAMTILALVYGEGDFNQTGQIACLAGFDCDCNCATACLLMGIKDGYSHLPAELKAKSGDTYYNTNRPGLKSDTLTHWAERVCNLGDMIITHLGGVAQNVGGKDGYLLKDGPFAGILPNEGSYFVRVAPTDDAVTKEGFSKFYDSETYLGTSYCTHEKGKVITYPFQGDEIHIKASRTINGGEWAVSVDDVNYGLAELKLEETFTLGSFVSQVYGLEVKKITGLKDGAHTLKLESLVAGAFHQIDSFEVPVSEATYYASDSVNFALSAAVTPICSVSTIPGTGNGGSHTLATIHDGILFPNHADYSEEYDTFLGYDANQNVYVKDYEDYFGYSLSRKIKIGRVVFTEGGHWAGGGWFADGAVRIESESDGVWSREEATCAPVYPTGDTLTDFGDWGETYAFVLSAPKEVDGIRIIGTPGGSQKITSCAELEIYRS
jgi:hypothetical protein